MRTLAEWVLRILAVLFGAFGFVELFDPNRHWAPTMGSLAIAAALALWSEWLRRGGVWVISVVTELPPAEPTVPLDNDPRSLLAFHEAYAEWAYTMMYETSSSTTASARYSDAKEALSEAIRLAREVGTPADVARLEQRREHIQSVFRSQFR